MKKILFKRQETIVISILAILSAASFFFDKQILSLSMLVQNSFLDSLFFIFSLNLSFFLPLLAIASLYLYLRKKKEGIIHLWVAVGAAFLLAYAVKFIVARPRPLGLEMTTTLFSLPDNAFPSAHAALSFAILAVIDEEFRKIKIAWLIIAILVVLSRLYFSFHYLSDVCFGALIGYLVGIGVVKILKK